MILLTNSITLHIIGTDDLENNLALLLSLVIAMLLTKTQSRNQINFHTRNISLINSETHTMASLSPRDGILPKNVFSTCVQIECK